MRIEQLELRDFRSYQRWSLEPDPALTILVGPNAIGKTNVIEAIQLVSTGASFRRPNWQDVVRWGEEQASVSMTAEGEGSHAEVTLTITADGTRTWRVGGVQKRRVSDATKFVPVVIFTPDDLGMVKGPAEQRRSTIDALGEQLSSTYGALKRDYARVLKQRNALLRDEGSSRDLEPWNEQLVALGARLYIHRKRLTARVSEAAQPIYQHLAAGENLDLSLTDKAGLHESLVSLEQTAVEEVLHAEIGRRAGEERARKTSLVGPHRDDIIFLVGGRDARAYASQGQQRTIALAWKWAEVTVVSEVLRKTPVLLLDDVMSELDETRRRALTELVQRDVQTFVTTTNTTYFEPALLRAARTIQLGA